MFLVPVLAAANLFLLAYGRLPDAALWTAIAAFTVLSFLLARHGHNHDNLTMIDHCAVTSALSEVSPGLKTVCLVALLFAAVAVSSYLFAATVLVLTTFYTLILGRTPAHTWLSLLAVPGAFILVSGLALLLDFSRTPGGILSIPFFGAYLVLTAGAQASALMVMAKAMAAVSCLYALSLSTPLYDLIEVLRRAHLPSVVIELMFLIYRYIFVLSAVLHDLSTAASSRLGFTGFAASYRSAGGIMAGLLTLSFQRASASFDAMESRCYDGTLRFLRTERPLRVSHVLTAACFGAVVCAVPLMGRWLM